MPCRAKRQQPKMHARQRLSHTARVHVVYLHPEQGICCLNWPAGRWSFFGAAQTVNASRRAPGGALAGSRTHHGLASLLPCLTTKASERPS